MNTARRTIAATQALLIFPAILFMGALVVRQLSPLQHEPAYTAQRIVMWQTLGSWMHLYPGTIPGPWPE